ncbi:hydrophobe/amphiphile efflux-3 (HAE3) family transporter [Secundilactobacillus paracollinoides]|uniref:efflux RND transporter permease subunit n=1 Tax=Secundilactobacillus paracollinoides TaxID=240427 RepID=UPI003F45D2EB
MKRLFTTIGENIHRHHKLWITVILIMTIGFAFGLPKIQMKMGNNVFVSSSSKTYQDSQTYQKKFGGDSLYLLLDGNQSTLLSHKTMQQVAKFDSKVSQVDNVRNTTDIVSSLNDQLSHAGTGNSSAQFNFNSKKLQQDLMAELSSKQKQSIQSKMQHSLTSTQQNQVQTYLLKQLTPAQKKLMAAAGAQAQGSKQQQQAMLQKQLTTKQQAAVQSYTMSLLNHQQQSQLADTVIPMLPKVQDMSTKLLRDIFLSDNGHVPSAMKQLLPKDGKHLLIIINTNKESSDMNTAVQINHDANQAIKQTNFSSSIKTRLGGQPAVLGQVRSKVITSMATLLAFAVVLMVIILLLIFSVRKRLLPLIFVLACLVWTFGLMGWLHIPLTLATMATLPIIIGLGTDFGVQFQNRYEEEVRKRQNSKEAISVAISSMGPAVGVSLIVMVFSFLTMYLSKAPLMQQFGLTLAIGVACSYVVEFGLMFSSLSLLDKHASTAKLAPKKLSQPSRLSLFLSHYAEWVTHHAGILLTIGVVLAGLGFSFEKSINIETDFTKMIPQNMTALKNTKYLQSKIGSTTYLTYLVEGNGQDIRDQDNLKTIDQVGQKVDHKYHDVTDVTSLSTAYQQTNGSLNTSQKQLTVGVDNLPTSLKQTLISSNHHDATIQFKIRNGLSSKEQLKLMNRINHDIKGIHHGLKISPAGAQVMMLLGINNMSANHDLIIIAGLSIIFIVLFLIYRDWRLALYPVIPILLVLGLSPLTLKLLGISYNPVTIALSSLVLGIGTEFTILILERYREELQRGNSTRDAIVSATASVGQAITVSGFTVMGGFSAIMFSSFPVLKSFGLITVLDTGYSLICALTILPAVIYLLRKRKPAATQSSSEQATERDD